MTKPARKPPRTTPGRPAAARQQPDSAQTQAALPGAPDTARVMSSPGTARVMDSPDTARVMPLPDTADTAQVSNPPDTASVMAAPPDSTAPASAPDTTPQPPDMRKKIGRLTRQLHDSLNELGYADQLRHSMVELPDAQSRLAYIARLTGEAAEKVLGRVEQAKAQHGYIASETRRVVSSLVKDPVAAVARGEIMNFLTDVERVTQEADAHLTEIMMAQDFHDLTGQVIARVVSLAATIEAQLVQMLLETAPVNMPGDTAAPDMVRARSMQGPVVEPDKRADVVTSQSQVDDLLASLGF